MNLVQITDISQGIPHPQEDVHVFNTDAGSFVLVVDGSRVYSVDAHTAALLRDGSSPAELEKLGFESCNNITDVAPSAMPIRSLSLAVVQKCNLGCTYCYAQEGTFGQEPRNMEHEVALNAVRLLFADATPGEKVNLTFLGGEPLLNRHLIHECTELGKSLSEATGVRITFSITTNGTLLTEEDGAFFEEHGFAVTISLDGVGETHDALRSYRGGRGSYQKIIANARPLLAMQRRMQVSARVTVTPKNLRLRQTLDELLSLGFHSVGFSPMLHAPSGRDEMHAASLRDMLDQMIECGEEFERRTVRGERYAFANLATAIQEIHKGTHRPYPCGAGAGYFGVSAEGGLYACHRFVEDDKAYFGDVRQGLNPEAQAHWLQERHVHTQSPCSGCWARYLCGGGCHHEVIHRGRPACQYVRGWLDYSLKAYVRLLSRRPDYFD
ncbi:MAG TPA: radical SAM protein [Candidatus Angelobacter sp.]|nr:radical SAM protein [Candidatus Angelobacter sp.]